MSQINWGGWQTCWMSDECARSEIEERIQILDGILDALDRMDEVNRAVRGSLNRIEARESLLAEPFCYSEVVATRILDLNVARQTVAGIEELCRERNQAADRLAELE
jgi:DNA gyrase/topoisomerase IV subunit A